MPLMMDEYAITRKVCKAYFFEFLKESWPVFCAEKPVWNWHIELLCNEIQEVYERIFRGLKKEYDLVINVPPGSTKSSIASIAAVPWAWTRMPSLRSMNGSHTQDLVLELSRKSREIIYSEWYQDIFPGIQLSESQNTKSHWANTKGGGRLCCTVGGKSPLGFHAHVHTVDDPINPKQSLSDVLIENANTWLIDTLSTRKVDKAITPLILIMQRLAQNDPSGYMLENFPNRVRHICLPAELTDDVKPPELAAKYDDNFLDPIRISRDVLEEEREKGNYYFCTPGFTPILMADWTEKNIEDIEEGDEVVGYVLGGNKKRAKIVHSIVTAKSVSRRDVVKITMESGRVIYCTPDHKWWTQRLDTGKWPRPSYLPAREGKKLLSVYSPLPKLTKKEQRMFDWLGGMIDGDGGRSGDYITISQSPTANPEVFAKIEKVLTKLNIPFSIDRRFRTGGKFDGVREVVNREECGTFILHGGRYTKMRLLNGCYCAKKNVILQAIWDQPGFVAEKKDKVLKIESAGEMEVFGLTTTSGNYVAWGYASQNSGQFLQNPIPIGGGMFKTDMLNIAPAAPSNIHFNRIIRSWDNAGSPKRGGISLQRRKRTAGVKIGAHKDGSYWIMDVRKGRWRVHQRELIKKITAQQDGSDVEIVQEQEGGSGGQESAEQTVRNLAGFNVKVINPSGRGDKVTKAEPLASQVNIGNVYLVKDNWNKDFIEEMKHFPFSTFKDQIDAAAQGFNEVYKPRRRCGPLFSSASR